MGKTKYVEVNHHLANIWDDALNIVLAHMLEAALEMGIEEERLAFWAFHAVSGGDSFSFLYPMEDDLDEQTMIAVVVAAQNRITIMGDVTPEMVAGWRLPLNDKLISEGSLRANKPVEVDRLLEVAEWLVKALRWEPEAEYDAEVGCPRR